MYHNGAEVNGAAGNAGPGGYACPSQAVFA